MGENHVWVFREDERGAVMRKYWPLVAAALILSFYFFLLLPPKEENKEKQTPKDLPEVEVLGSDFKNYLNDGRELLIKSKKVKLYKKENKVVFGHNQGRLLEEKAEKMTFQGEEGTFYLDTKNIALKGKVKAQSFDGKNLQADEVNYEAAADKLTGKGHIVYQDGDKIISGDAFVTNTALDRVEITGHARVTERKE